MAAGVGVSDAAASPAVTGAASAVTNTSAVLNGTVDPGGLSTFWAFQYGTTASYGQDTAPVGPLTSMSPMSVSTLLRGLSPDTTYHFRVVAVQGAAGTSGEATGYTGADVTFTTTGSGSIVTTSKNGSKSARASLRSRTFHVHSGAAQVPWACSGSSGAACKVKMTLSAHGNHGSASCGHGTFSAAAGKHGNVRVSLGSKCLSLVKSASHHRLGATLNATSSAGSGSLKVGVTLVG
jgi:hypothetical protein